MMPMMSGMGYIPSRPAKSITMHTYILCPIKQLIAGGELGAYDDDDDDDNDWQGGQMG